MIFLLFLNYELHSHSFFVIHSNSGGSIKICGRSRKPNPYQYNQSCPVPVPGCQFKRQAQACTVQACDEQAGLDTPWSSSTLQMATIPLLWPRIPLPASNTNTNTPWTRTTGARWSILAPSPSTTPGTLELVRTSRSKQHQAATAWPFALLSIKTSHQPVPLS